jgi:MFS family permease
MLNRIGLNRNLTVVCLTIFTNMFTKYTWAALLPLHLRSLGASDLEIGAAFTAMAFAQRFFGILGGWLADRFGRRMMIAAATFTMGPFYLLASMGHDWLAVASMLVGVEMCNGFQGPPLTALISESSDPDRVAHAFSFSESAVLVGLILGPLAGAQLLQVVHLPTLILASSVVMIFNGILRGWGLRESSAQRVGSAMPKLHTAIDANVRWFILVAALVVGSFAIVYGPYFAILARDAWHNSDAEINWLWSAGCVASLIGILFGRVSDRWGGKRVLIISAIVYGVTTIAWGIAPTWVWGFVPLMLSFAFSEALFMAQQTLQAEITTPQTRASVIGVISTSAGFIGGLGPTMGAWLIILGGNPMPFIAAGVMGLLVTLAVAPVNRKVARAVS